MQSAPLPTRCVLITPQADLLAKLKPLFRAAMPGVPVNHVEHYSIDLLLRSGMGSALVLVDATSNRENALALFQQLADFSQEVHVLALSFEDDPEFVLQCLRAGAADYLREPINEEQLAAALARMARFCPLKHGKSTIGQVIVTIPAKGSCGASTVAVNLAFHAARRKAGRILLADLDPYGGSVAFALKARPIGSYLDKNAHELDSDSWASMVTRADGFDVLLSPDSPGDVRDNLHDPGPILNYARNHYDLVIADASRVYGAWNLNVARFATDLVLVTTNELVAMHAARRSLRYLEFNRVNLAPLRLVVSRYQPERGIDRKFVVEAVGTGVYHTLPNDYLNAHRSLMEGVAIPESVPLGRGLHQLSSRLLGQEEKVARKKPDWKVWWRKPTACAT